MVLQNLELSDCLQCLAGVPQGSTLSPYLFKKYTADVPVTPNTEIATYADDTVILGTSEDPVAASNNVQHHLNILSDWLDQWRIQVNSAKSVHVMFSLRKGAYPRLFLKNEAIPEKREVRYLGIIFDKSLTWGPHVKMKRLTLNSRLKQLYRFVNKRLPLSLSSKLLLYKSLLKPIWTYALQVFGTTKPSNLNKLQAFQSKFLRLITKAPFYVNNKILHSDLKIPFITDVAKSFYSRFHKRLHTHTNPLVKKISEPHLPGNPRRRLNRKWSRDLL